MKKIYFLIIFFLLGCGRETIDNTPYIKYENPSYQKISASKTFQGFIDRGLDTDLSFGLSGIMNGLYVREGDFVKKGKLLAKLDNNEYKYSISRAKSELDDAIIRHDKAKSYFERISKLHQAGGISYNDWETAQTDLKTSINQIAILKDALKIAQNKETFSNIYAPSDGYIIKVYKDLMEFSSSGDSVILFQGAGELEARIFVSQNDINEIKLNQEVILTSDAIKDKKYKGKIKSKVNSSINTGSFRVTVSIKEDAKELLDGMSINVEIPKENQKCVLLLPLSAIVNENGKSFVYVVENDIALKKEIETADIFGDKISVKKGIFPEDLVVVEGVNKIMDGLKVKSYEYK